MKYFITGAAILLAINGFAQTKVTPLADDLIKDKQAVLAQFIPMSTETYLYAAYQIEPDAFLEKLNDFKAAVQKTFSNDADATTKALKTKDVDYYSRNVLQHYKIFYGMDSVAMESFNKLMMDAKGKPDFMKLVDSAYKTVYPKKLSAADRARIDSLSNKEANVNDAALYKRSAAYREYIDGFITRLRSTKYKADTALGYQGINVVKLKVVKNEISDPFIKEHLSYTLTSTVIKSVKNEAAKEKAYQDFMATATNATWKSDVKKVYDNYKFMNSHAQAPDFTYTNVDNKRTSLKDLRGKYVYIDVWATWCTPCKAEIPFLTKIEEAYEGKNIRFVSLSVDRIGDKAKWQTYVKEHKLPGIQVMADNDFKSEFIQKFNINSIPRFILIDPKGNIVDADAKRPSDPELTKQLDSLL